MAKHLDDLVRRQLRKQSKFKEQKRKSTNGFSVSQEDDDDKEANKTKSKSTVLKLLDDCYNCHL